MRPGDLDAAVLALRRGGVIAYPTEAIWGLGCDPMNEAAVTRLFELKQRPDHMGVVLIGASQEQVLAYAEPLSEDAMQRVEATWPGPNTWVFPRRASVPGWLHGAHAGIALRVTSHAPAVALCRAFNAAIVSTSANLHGQPAARTAAEVRSMFGDRLDAIVDDVLGGLDRPTTIRDAISGETLRA